MLRRRQIDFLRRLGTYSSEVIINRPENHTFLAQNFIKHVIINIKNLSFLSTITARHNLQPAPQLLRVITITSLPPIQSPANNHFLQRTLSNSRNETIPYQPLTLTQSAIDRLLQLQDDGGNNPVFLRLKVEGGGCSGFQYEFSLDSRGPQKGDTAITTSGVTLLCDDVSLGFLKGSVVDFESDLMRSSFVVQSNPNAQSSCGCGSSFSA